MTNTVTHVNGPTVVLNYAGLTIVSDPTFDAAGSRFRLLGLIPMKKTTDPSVSAESVGKVDLVLVSHGQHADNFDTAGRAMAASANAVIAGAASARGINGATGLRTWESTRVTAPAGVVTVTAVPARHAAYGVHLIAGPVTGFVLECEGQPTVYITGDNISRAAVRKVTAKFTPDLVVFHAGAPKFTLTGPIPFCMTAAQGVEALKEFMPGKVVMVHSDGWSHFSEAAADVDAAFAGSGLEGSRVATGLGVAAAF